MIIRFSAENYRSIKDRQELTLVASSLKDLPESLIKLGQVPNGILPVAAIYGANASGKTNVIRALHFISSAVEDSHKRWDAADRIPRAPFRFDDSPNRPSSFDIEFIVTDVRYRYGFTLDSEKVHEEWLYAYPKGKQQRWFSRVEDPERKFVFGRNLPGEKTRTIEGLTRPNSLYLSAAAQNNHETLLPIYNFLANDIRFSVSRSETGEPTAGMCQEDKYKNKFLQYLKAADLGVAGLRIEESEMDENMKKIVSFINQTLPPKTEVEVPTKVTNTLFQHSGRGESKVEFGIQDESAGTVAYFSLLGPVETTLENGGVLCVDELDSSLHPLLALQLVRTFNDSKSNPRGAQLIFNTHDTNLLDNSLLRRDQIWFTEKDSSGATHLYPLSDFRPRRNENLERGYLQGRYGAIPFIESHFALQDRDD